MTNFKKVLDFMTVFRHNVRSSPGFPDTATQDLRVALIEEELQELREAIANKDLVEVADALADLLYVSYGAGCSFGIDLDACFDEVHASNMTKLGADGNPIFREDGKIMKGPNFRVPNLKTVLGL